jgi:NAD(P)-dependent dehydrogenase (short-subunit alcohol dehydrogenase family)
LPPASRSSPARAAASAARFRVASRAPVLAPPSLSWSIASRAKLGPIDILVSNAGVARQRPALEEITERDWDESLAVNLTASFLLAQRVLPGMRQRRFGRVRSSPTPACCRAIPRSYARRSLSTASAARKRSPTSRRRCSPTAT